MPFNFFINELKYIPKNALTSLSTPDRNGILEGQKQGHLPEVFEPKDRVDGGNMDSKKAKAIRLKKKQFTINKFI
jgi:hypothetical protein